MWVSVSHIPCPRNDFPSIRKRKRIMAIPKFWVPHVLIYLKTQIRKPHYKRSCFAPPINPRLFHFFFFFPHCKNFAPKFLIPQTQTQTLCWFNNWYVFYFFISYSLQNPIWVYQTYAYMCYIQCVCVWERDHGDCLGFMCFDGVCNSEPTFSFCIFFKEFSLICWNYMIYILMGFASVRFCFIL